jgi:hypothetical protein
MSSAGTLISDLGGGSSSDGDLVQQIFAEMNSSNENSNTNLPPAPSSRAVNKMIQSGPNPNTTAMHSMDGMPPQAHIIGGHQPTPADFAHMMGSQAMPMGPVSMGMGGPGGYYPQQQMQQMQPQYIASQSGGDIKQFIAKELKTPILVAIIAFIMSLPVVNTMVAHYLPSLIRVTGELTTSGLLLKAVVAGGLFWTLQRIIVPLLM